VANDGDHATAIGCSKNAVYFDDTTRLATEIKYYQGPPTQIALIFAWRKVSGPTVPADCSGSVGSNGWKVIAPANFLAPPTPAATTGI